LAFFRVAEGLSCALAVEMCPPISVITNSSETANRGTTEKTRTTKLDLIMVLPFCGMKS
jgi:hypothetical protein